MGGVGWITDGRCVLRRVIYCLWANLGRGSPSNVSKAPDVKASKTQKIKDMFKTCMYACVAALLNRVVRDNSKHKMPLGQDPKLTRA